MDLNISQGYKPATSVDAYKSKLGTTSSSNQYLRQWNQKYKNLQFYIGDSPYAKKGTGSVVITKEEMTKLQNDPKKRAEFEKSLKECDKVAKQMASSGDARLKSMGFFVDKEGELQGWTIANNYASQPQKYIVKLDPEQSTKWKSAMCTYMTVSNPYYSDWSSRFSASSSSSYR